MRALLTFTWFFHILLSAGAGYAMLRLWHHRKHPLMGRMGLYMTGFVVEGALDTVLLFISATCRPAAYILIWAIGTWARDLPRMPLVLYIITGPGPGEFPIEARTSGEQEPEFWLTSFNRIVRRHTKQKRYRQTR